MQNAEFAEFAEFAGFNAAQSFNAGPSVRCKLTIPEYTAVSVSHVAQSFNALPYVHLLMQPSTKKIQYTTLSPFALKKLYL